MTFTYPAVFMPHKNDKGYHVTFPDLQCCEADGPDLEDLWYGIWYEMDGRIEKYVLFP